MRSITRLEDGAVEAIGAQSLDCFDSPEDSEVNDNADTDKAGKREESFQLCVIVLFCYVIELLH